MIQQLSLFAEQEREIQWKFADKVCEEFNKIDTVWKGGFYIKDAGLENWDHVQLKNKVLSITLDSKRNKKDKFIYFDGNPQSQMNLYNIPFESELIGKLNKDKDFSINITPWKIYIYYHNFEKKKFDL